METLNEYGDLYKKTTGIHGADISSQRMDDLDKKCLIFALNLQNDDTKISVDLGAGFGSQSLKLALIGIEAHMYDILDVSKEIDHLKQLLQIHNLYFHKKDIGQEDFSTLKPIDLVYSQRFIHYLPYATARLLAQNIYKRLKIGGRVFISASGINTELSTDYRGKEVPVQMRYFPLSQSMREKHGISTDVCLYSKEELSDLFCSNGFKEIQVWESGFKNIKAIFEK